jgi:uncharacterized protein with NAD-binding domain and iron-sulfur cluster
MTGAPRVLILGGGMAGLAAAWRLSEPGWERRWSAITVVERSFRLGGKGASGRGAHGRIEEHGLHVWLGHYDNAFRLIRECYTELDRERTDPHCPIRTWTDAFMPAGELGLFDRGPNGWAPWVATFTGNRDMPGEPGIDAGAPPIAELLVRSALLIRDFYASLDIGRAASPAITLSTSPVPPAPPHAIGATIRGLSATLLAVSAQLLALARMGARRLTGPAGAAAIDAAFAPLLARLRPAVRSDAGARRLHDLVDLVRSVLSGMAADRLVGDRAAYDAINHLDFRDWLRSHGAGDSTLRSAIVRGQYDLVFSHVHGDPDRPRFAAGWGVFLSAKLWFAYKGAIFWKMRAGMGDVVFAPLYQALVARGVQFRFDTEVEELVVSSDGSAIRSAVVTEPADLSDHQPLMAVKGLPCFPAAVGGAPGTRRGRELRCGDDFDVLVFAIPPAAGRLVCRQLAEDRREWRDMFDHIGTVATHAFQVWLKPEERSLGWAHPGTTVSAFTKPFDTWASMSHVLEFEDWDQEHPPATVGYFCSTLPEAAAAPGREASRYTRDAAVEFLQRHGRHFWPNAFDPTTRGFRWDLLCADNGVSGPERFDTQYWTANTDPSDRYVQSLPGTDAYRLRADRSGYANLFLAGDWTDCGINAGCIEAAAVSGLQAANGVLGRPHWDRIGGQFLR